VVKKVEAPSFRILPQDLFDLDAPLAIRLARMVAVGELPVISWPARDHRAGCAHGSGEILRCHGASLGRRLRDGA
jgi:hypothetical protein